MRSQTGKVVLPRALRAPDAAHYIGLSKSKFLELVSAGRLPSPIRIDGCRVWDRYELDDAFETFEAKKTNNPWDP